MQPVVEFQLGVYIYYSMVFQRLSSNVFISDIMTIIGMIFQ
jgi:hypothetical protein